MTSWPGWAVQLNRLAGELEGQTQVLGCPVGCPVCVTRDKYNDRQMGGMSWIVCMYVCSMCTLQNTQQADPDQLYYNDNSTEAKVSQGKHSHTDNESTF